MSHEFETGMFVKTPAWHKLGTVLDHVPTIAEAIVAAGLDWKVGLEQLQLPDGTPVTRYGVVRDSDRRVLGTVGEDFRTVQNQAAFDWFQPFLDGGFVDLEAAGSLKKGSRVWVLAKVRNHGHASAEIVPGDTVANYLLLAHGHDGSLAVHLGLTPTRVVCQNTLSAAVSGRTTLKIRHTTGAQAAMDAARDVMDRANGQFDAAVEVYRALAGRYVTTAQIKRYVDAVFPAPKPMPKPAVKASGIDAVAFMAELRAETQNAELVGDLLASGAERKVADPENRRIADDILRLFESGAGNDLPGVKGTAWGAYNAVTEYLSHERGRSDDNRQNTAWFGPEGERAIKGAVSTFLE